MVLVMQMTSTDNLPILYQNIMDGLPSDFARDVFLWAVERPNQDRMLYKAEEFAREADRLKFVSTFMLDAGARVHGLEKHDPDLMEFILKRHANWRYGGNLKTFYPIPEE